MNPAYFSYLIWCTQSWLYANLLGQYWHPNGFSSLGTWIFIWNDKWALVVKLFLQTSHWCSFWTNPSHDLKYASIHAQVFYLKALFLVKSKKILIAAVSGKSGKILQKHCLQNNSCQHVLTMVALWELLKNSSIKYTNNY